MLMCTKQSPLDCLKEKLLLLNGSQVHLPGDLPSADGPAEYDATLRLAAAGSPRTTAAGTGRLQAVA